jgi:hypothetical protein
VQCGAVHLPNEGARDEEEYQADVREVGCRIGHQADQGAAVVLEVTRNRRGPRGVAGGGSLRHAQLKFQEFARVSGGRK